MGCLSGPSRGNSESPRFTSTRVRSARIRYRKDMIYTHLNISKTGNRNNRKAMADLMLQYEVVGHRSHRLRGGAYDKDCIEEFLPPGKPAGLLST